MRHPDERGIEGGVGVNIRGGGACKRDKCWQWVIPAPGRAARAKLVVVERGSGGVNTTNHVCAVCPFLALEIEGRKP